VNETAVENFWIVRRKLRFLPSMRPIRRPDEELRMMANMMRRHFPVAPWPRNLKIISALGTALLVVLVLRRIGQFQRPRGLPLLWPGNRTRPSGNLVGSLIFMVTGYSVDGSTLIVQRLFFSTEDPAWGVRRVFADPAVCKGSVRVIGNAGLFSFTGLYQSKALGRYRLFATDFSRSVVMVLLKG